MLLRNAQGIHNGRHEHPKRAAEDTQISKMVPSKQAKQSKAKQTSKAQQNTKDTSKTATPNPPPISACGKPFQSGSITSTSGLLQRVGLGTLNVLRFAEPKTAIETQNLTRKL